MRLLARWRARGIRALRWPLAALATSALGRAMLRGVLSVLGTRAVHDIHDDALGWLVRRPLRGRRRLLARRLRDAARGLAYRPGIFAGGSEAVVTLVVAWGLSPERLGELVTKLYAEDPGSAFSPLFLTDCDDFRAFRQLAAPFEHIPSRDEWTRHHGPAGWQEYLSRRIAEVLDTWSPDRVVVVRDEGSDAAARDGVLRALASAR